MKMKKYLIIALTLIITLVSCNIEMLPEGESVNEYIFPYMEFTLSPDGTYYTASVIKGASLESIFVPAYVAHGGESVPVKYFAGFKSDGDIVNLKSVELESSITEIKLDSLNQASILSSIKYDKVDSASARWKNLPSLPHTEDGEFLGWYLTNNPDVRIRERDVMIPGYTAIYPKWGEHDYQMVAAKAPTCTESGHSGYKVCRNCSYSTEYVEIPSLGHQMPLEKHDKKDATCVSTGLSDDIYECRRCHVYFSDPGGVTEVDINDYILPKTGHTSDGTIYKNDTQHWWHCVIEDIDYGFEDHRYSEWTESEDEGFRERTCSVCGHTEKTDIPHNWVKVDAVGSTCTEKGHTVYWKCTAHTGEYSVREDQGEIITTEEELHRLTDLPLEEHSLGDWITDDDNHWKVCSVCNDIFEKGSHSYEYTFDTEEGERALKVTRKCTVCGMEDISTTEHAGAFEITASFGAVKAEKVANMRNTWKLRYTAQAADCYWSDEGGNRIIDGADPFTVSYASGSSGTFKVYCHVLDSSGREVDIAFAVLKAY